MVKLWQNVRLVEIRDEVALGIKKGRNVHATSLVFGEPGGTRTHNQLIKSQMLDH
jgi:hypothetical protein